MIDKIDDEILRLLAKNGRITLSELAKKVKPSERGEKEITTLNQMYLEKGLLHVGVLERGVTWLDTGTVKNNLSSSNFVSVIEERQNYKIACIEEIAFKNKWIQRKNLKDIIKKMGKCEYSKYLKNILN